MRFRRTRFGRRGLAEEHVYAFLRVIVDELIARAAWRQAFARRTRG
ncbi:hypothetical protein [Micromonospora sp. KC606]|nr:hypothetical protein [Micromonospora sp. KC606]